MGTGVGAILGRTSEADEKVTKNASSGMANV